MFHCLQKRFSAHFAEPWGELASRLASEIAKFFVHQQFGCDHFYFHFLFTNLLITFVSTLMLRLLSQGVFAAFRVYMQQRRVQFASFARISVSKASNILDFW